MALWMVRTGRHGQHEQLFLESNRIYVCWDGLRHDLSAAKSRDDIERALKQVYPKAAGGRVAHHARQIWAFHSLMQPGDWVIVPSKKRPAIHVAEVRGAYTFDADAENPYYHYRDVRWIEQDIPRSNFDQDLLYSLGAFMTICRIKRNDAEPRVRAMAEHGWKVAGPALFRTTAALEDDHEDDTGAPSDLEQIARDQLAKLIIARFKGHGMARLVDAILRAQGYTTHVSPEGPDKGVDLLAAPGPMGFGQPKICVQVKSGSSPLDRPTLDQLIGAMQNVQADHGLLVSWGGFKSSVDKEKAIQFFRVRLWDQNDLIEQLLEHYEQLDDDVRNELPLKRIWMISTPDEE